MQAQLLHDAGAELGESPVWDDETSSLIWVDIVNAAVYRTDPSGGTTLAWQGNDVIGAVAPLGHSQWLVAGRTDISLVTSWQTETPFGQVKHAEPTARLNDGKVDPNGRFVIGSLNEAHNNPTNALYSVDASGTTALVQGITISNGMAWSADTETFFYIDTPTRQVDAFDYDTATGTVTNRRPFATFDDDWGVPDGLTLDSFGNLWVACWGGNAVRNFDSHGALQHVVEVAAHNPTSCAFAPDGTLYITSAAQESPRNTGDGGVWIAEPT